MEQTQELLEQHSRFARGEPSVQGQTGPLRLHDAFPALRDLFAFAGRIEPHR